MYLSRKLVTMASSARGLRLIKALEHYSKTKPNYFDSGKVFNKVKLLSVSDGHLHGTFTVDSSMCNVCETLHGGYISSVIDALTLFAHVGDKGGKLSWTTNLHVDFFKSANKGEQLSVKVSPLSKGKHHVMEACLYNEGGALVAKGRASFIQGSDKFQQMAKDALNFDAYED